jgi:hypothetical protein
VLCRARLTKYELHGRQVIGLAHCGSRRGFSIDRLTRGASSVVWTLTTTLPSTGSWERIPNSKRQQPWNCWPENLACRSPCAGKLIRTVTKTGLGQVYDGVEFPSDFNLTTFYTVAVVAGSETVL